MTILYCTADSIGAETGGGIVSAQELLALREFSDQETRQRRDPTLSSVTVFSRANLGNDRPEPWKWDQRAVERLEREFSFCTPRFAHIYSGTWPLTVAYLKSKGAKVTVTIAAHDRIISRKEHEKLGWPFNLPHLVEHDQWMKYIEGYRLADAIICPGSVPANIVRRYGPEFLQKRIEIIPHGCHLPEEIKPLPKSFICGYAGSLGADKGVRYLLEAWKRLDYKDGSMLVLSGRDSTTPLARHMINQYGGGSIRLAGWQEKMCDFYDSISLYVQPSASEGFGLEILEAASYGRPVICSRGAGAADLLTGEEVVDACDAEELATAINQAKNHWILQDIGQCNRKIAEDYTWDKIRNKYKQLWTEVLDGRV